MQTVPGTNVLTEPGFDLRNWSGMVLCSFRASGPNMPNFESVSLQALWGKQSYHMHTKK